MFKKKNEIEMKQLEERNGGNTMNKKRKQEEVFETLGMRALFSDKAIVRFYNTIPDLLSVFVIKNDGYLPDKAQRLINQKALAVSFYAEKDMLRYKENYPCSREKNEQKKMLVEILMAIESFLRVEKKAMEHPDYKDSYNIKDYGEIFAMTSAVFNLYNEYISYIEEYKVTLSDEAEENSNLLCSAFIRATELEKMHAPLIIRIGELCIITKRMRLLLEN